MTAGAFVRGGMRVRRPAPFAALLMYRPIMRSRLLLIYAAVHNLSSKPILCKSLSLTIDKCNVRDT